MKWLTLMIALSLSTTASAQSAAMPEPAAPPAIEISTNDKDAFVQVYEKIVTIQEKYSKQLNDKSTPEEVNKISQEAQGEMAAAIDKQEGIDIPKYNEILLALESNPKLREEIQKKLEKKM